MEGGCTTSPHSQLSFGGGKDGDPRCPGIDEHGTRLASREIRQSLPHSKHFRCLQTLDGSLGASSEEEPILFKDNEWRRTSWARHGPFISSPPTCHVPEIFQDWVNDVLDVWLPSLEAAYHVLHVSVIPQYQRRTNCMLAKKTCFWSRGWGKSIAHCMANGFLKSVRDERQSVGFFRLVQMFCFFILCFLGIKTSIIDLWTMATETVLRPWTGLLNPT